MPDKISFPDITAIENELLQRALKELSPEAFKLFMYVYSNAQAYIETGCGFEQKGEASIAGITGLSASTVVDSFVELRKLGWLTGLFICRFRSNDQLFYRWSMSTFQIDARDTLEEVFPGHFNDEIPIVVGAEIFPPSSYEDRRGRKYTTHFRAIRQQVLNRDGNKCTECGREQDLHAHHLTYENEGNEKLEDLITLCASCHGRARRG